MTSEPTTAIVVRFLRKHDLINEAARQRISGGQPRNLHTAQSLLQRLEERHEVPHGKDVVLHECPYGVETINLTVNTMYQQGFPAGVQPLVDSGDEVQLRSHFNGILMPT